jgi:hypothetical protein
MAKRPGGNMDVDAVGAILPMMQIAPIDRVEAPLPEPEDEEAKAEPVLEAGDVALEETLGNTIDLWA